MKFVLAAYLVIGILYAVKTPPWQVPDEPAHYNYVKYLAENYRLPVLRMGDYPHDYLEEIKANRFPPEMSIEPLRYEFHQPPLYYVLAAVVYKLFAGKLLPLRLLSVLLGCCLLWVAYHVAKEIFPGDEALALGATAFVAFVPMHIAITAAVNNDTLAELILAVILWMLVRYVKLVRWSGGRMVGEIQSSKFKVQSSKVEDRGGT
ncbi:MAG: glycosyltransferase family 39 protein, partial [Anaerolineae bacterium]